MRRSRAIRIQKEIPGPLVIEPPGGAATCILLRRIDILGFTDRCFDDHMGRQPEGPLTTGQRIT